MQEQFRVSKDPDGNQREDEWQPPHADATAEWTEISGVWVPTTATVELLTRLPDASVVFRAAYELAFEWHGVNRDFDPQLFSLEGLDIPPGSHWISDRRSSTNAVVTQQSDVPDAEMLRPLESLRDPSSGAPSRMAPHWLTWALVTVMLVGATGVIVYFFVIRR